MKRKRILKNTHTYFPADFIFDLCVDVAGNCRKNQPRGMELREEGMEGRSPKIIPVVTA